MTTTEPTQQLDLPDLRPTPTGWLALGHDYPRIGVMEATRKRAITLFQREREAWRRLGATS